eukprot:TRINITY_DN335_c0_g1_i3.p1 TRINITY_DN335_c0_g1~~TRINITY_DN335_c0_g1_i3.p1  ORF type:complete len:694 (+),score=62.57 TRINITY_DN335_c0_g1_i3:160-2241(+)
MKAEEGKRRSQNQAIGKQPSEAEKEKASLAEEIKAEASMAALPASEGQVVLQTLKHDENKGLLHVSVVPSAEGPRRPSVIVCLLDVSGSMDSAATDANTGETDGFSILDLVKHSVKTIIHTLDESDYIALVQFESKAALILPPQQMTAEGRKIALEKVEGMRTLGTTNLWDGLKTSIDLIHANEICKKASTSLWLFTDGQPDSHPGGIAPALKSYLKGSSPPCVINSFGFGYSLDSELLYEISEIGNGVFCYVPDCNLLGTTFVNCLSNTMATSMYKCWLRINGENADNLKCIGYEVKDGKVELGTVQYGQTRDILFQFDMPKDKEVKFAVQLKCQLGVAKKEIQGIKTDDPVAVYRAYCRSKYNEIIREGLKKCVAGSSDLTFLKQVEDIIGSLPSKEDEATKALLKDITSPDEMEGRVSKAFSTAERIRRWGGHYVRSIIRAHKLQQAHNFKDPGVQVYGGKMFKDFQRKADKTFCNLPPPVPSLQPVKRSAPGSSAPAAPVSMDSYMDCSGGCFDGSCSVTLIDGTHKLVKDLKKGDVVLSQNGTSAKVVCLVVFPMKQSMKMVNLNGLLITPKHPVMHHGVWTFPKEIAPTQNYYMENIYNIVLDQNHSLTINETEVVTLGHGKYENVVIRHQYYGSERVIEDIKRMKGWEEGFVSMEGCRKYKDPFTGVVMCINQTVDSWGNNCYSLT